MKPYLFLSCLLLGTGISMSSLMADTHVVNASCNDARFGACTSAQTSLMADTHVVNASCNDARFGACTTPPSEEKYRDADYSTLIYLTRNSSLQVMIVLC